MYCIRKVASIQGYQRVPLVNVGVAVDHQSETGCFLRFVPVTVSNCTQLVETWKLLLQKQRSCCHMYILEVVAIIYQIHKVIFCQDFICTEIEGLLLDLMRVVLIKRVVVIFIFKRYLHLFCVNW